MILFEYENEPVKNDYNKTAIKELSIFGLFGKENRCIEARDLGIFNRSRIDSVFFL